MIEAKKSPAPDVSNQSRLYRERRREWDRFREAISATASQSLKGARYLPFLEAGMKICSEVSRLNHTLVARCIYRYIKIYLFFLTSFWQTISCIEAHRDGEEARRRMEATLVALESGMTHLTHALKIEIQVLDQKVYRKRSLIHST